jgi:hypothetical protein
MTDAEAHWLSLAVIVLVSALALVHEVAFIYRVGPEASLSRVVSRLLERYPSGLLALVFWLGVLAGHC